MFLGFGETNTCPRTSYLLSSGNAQSSNPSHFGARAGSCGRLASLSRGRLTHPAAHMALDGLGGSSGGQATAARSSREGATAASAFQLSKVHATTRREPPARLYYNPQPTPPPAEAPFPAQNAPESGSGPASRYRLPTRALLPRSRPEGRHPRDPKSWLRQPHTRPCLLGACARGQPRGSYFR